jgi:hypothetical protein
VRGHNRENHIYIIMFILKKKSSPEPAGQFKSNLVQIILGYMEFKIVQMKGQILFKGEIITKIKKLGEVIEIFFPREPLSQNCSDLYESFLT